MTIGNDWVQVLKYLNSLFLQVQLSIVQGTTTHMGSIICPDYMSTCFVSFSMSCKITKFLNVCNIKVNVVVFIHH